jgi:hypothetical protein
MNKANQILPLENIQNRIFTIRGVQVMLDKDIAYFYEVKPIRLREQVKRNSGRFPGDFMFRLTSDEVNLLVSQNAIPSKQQLGGYLPYVFTEQGVAAVSAIIKSKKAEEISVLLMRAFVEMRNFLTKHAEIFQRIENVELKQIKADSKIDQILTALEDKNIKPKQGIFFNGQIFDAYVFVNKLIKSAKRSIVLIDNYVDESVLTMLSKRNEQVTARIFTNNISKQLKLDLQKHNEQYPDIILKTYKNSHDRFLIIDNLDVYHIGASLKDLGKKWFAFSKIEINAGLILNKLN